MQILVVYYSRSGHTRQIAQEVSKELKCDIEEIQDTVNWSGPIGWLNAGRQASSRALTKLQPIKNDPSKYDLVIIGTPVWAGTMSTPVRTYITENKEKLKKVAFVITEGGRGEEATFKEMEELCGKKAAATVFVKVGEIKKGEYSDKVKKFAQELMV